MFGVQSRTLVNRELCLVLIFILFLPVVVCLLMFFGEVRLDLAELDNIQWQRLLHYIYYSLDILSGKKSCILMVLRKFSIGDLLC